MATDNTSRAVKTYVDETQRAEWQAEADRLDMSQSEFVAAMVQAGRRKFGLEDLDSNPGSSAPVDADPGGNALQTAILAHLEDGVKGWDELLEALEADLEATLQDLQSADRIRHDPREGGYVVTEDDDGE